jgi:hypothetical protein
MTDEQFHNALPVEFWREVVDRVAKECPDTLLLAEAFWLMESYFVRTLGMHRVYNSAFMHMLRNEDNAGYRTILKNTLEYDPEILKRYVNFMNNPDERTAVEQFGKGDKYFGICTLMATLPGLPMLGHGQIEGYAEKYGMEFRKPYWNESPDPGLISRHEFEIFPLLHQRELFAGVDNFWMYDFERIDGLDENVYAFTNASHGKYALVVYNNNFLETSGRIKGSVGQAVRSGKSKHVKKTDVAKVFHLTRNYNAYLKFRDQSSGLWFIRPVDELIYNGFSFHLQGYEHHAFLDFQVVISDENHDYGKLWYAIGHNGVPDLDTALEELVLQPVIAPFMQLMDKGFVDYLYSRINNINPVSNKITSEFTAKIGEFLTGIDTINSISSNRSQVTVKMVNRLLAFLELKKSLTMLASPESKQVKRLAISALKKFETLNWIKNALTGWIFVSDIGDLISTENGIEQSLSWIDQWHLGKPFVNLCTQSALSWEESNSAFLAMKIAVKHQDWAKHLGQKSVKTLLREWLSDINVQSFLKVNRYNDILWYDREAFSNLLCLMELTALIQSQINGRSDSTLAETLISINVYVKQIMNLDKHSSYQVENLVN